MADKKGNASAYGAPATDTDFRKNYDLDEYAARAEKREAEEREERKARYEAKLAGKKYYKPATGDETYATAQKQTFDFSSHVGKTTIVGADGKAGFPCIPCGRTFKDNKQYTEHIHSAEHLAKTGQKTEVRRATVEEVRARIEYWVRRREEEAKEKVTTLDERLKVREEEDEKEREEKRAKRRAEAEQRRVKQEEAERAKGGYGEDLRIEGEHDEDDMMAAMGITGFGTSKK